MWRAAVCRTPSAGLTFGQVSINSCYCAGAYCSVKLPHHVRPTDTFPATLPLTPHHSPPIITPEPFSPSLRRNRWQQGGVGGGGGMALDRRSSPPRRRSPMYDRKRSRERSRSLDKRVGGPGPAQGPAPGTGQSWVVHVVEQLLVSGLSAKFYLRLDKATAPRRGSLRAQVRMLLLISRGICPGFSVQSF